MSDSTGLTANLSIESSDTPSAKMIEKRNLERLLGVFVPVLTVLVLLVLWQLLVVCADIPQYILPSPTAVAKALYSDWGILWPALWVTTEITFISLILALIGGVGLPSILWPSSFR